MRTRQTKQIPINDDVPSFSQDEIKNMGKVYTPSIIVMDIINRYQSLLEQSNSICDPSMGQGNFLRGIFTTLISMGLTPIQAFEKLYGFDIDPIAVDKAQQYFIEEGIDQNIVKKHLMCLNPVITSDEWQNQFDVIIGNPPYVRSPCNIPSQYTLRANLVDVFFEVGMSLLKQSGTLIYIVQDSFLTNEDTGLRNYLSQYNLVSIETRFDYSKIFRRYNVAVDICLVELTKHNVQQPTINVWKHQPFKAPATLFKPDVKWNIYPSRIIELSNQLNQFEQSLSDISTITKGRLVNKLGTIPASYGTGNYGKNKNTILTIPVIGEPNLDYFFPKQPIKTVNYARKIGQGKDIPFNPFIALPYFTSKFRFCLIEEDMLTTPLVYVIQSADPTWLLPLLNNSVTDFQIRYNTKSRDTGYEFKKSTFDCIKFPVITMEQQQQLRNLVSLLRSKQITISDCDTWVCEHIYKLSTEELSIIQECKEYWFKKHVKTFINPPSP